jgi:hypothetical protein
MSIRLKRVGEMYQRGMQKCHHQQGHNREAYIDDVVNCTQESEGLIPDLAETFDSLRKFSMKLM